MNRSTLILVTFAVKEESQPFQKLAGARADLRITLTGMGRRNAENAIHTALASFPPQLVISSGFAGGLDPALAAGDVVFEADDGFAGSSALMAAGAHAVQFHCSERVVVSTEAKRELRRTTGAKAVEMESKFIRAVCRERGIPSATVRVISDAAHEELPLDFDQLLTPDMRMDYAKLAWKIARSPGTIGGLLRFQKQVRAASERLAAMLLQVVEARTPVS
jgi:adenosylhomocysteine nucleosidase